MKKVPLVCMRALTRLELGHTPLPINFGVQAHVSNKDIFCSNYLCCVETCFTIKWQSSELLHPLVIPQLRNEKTSLDISAIFLKGGKNRSGIYKKQKEKLLSIMDVLELKVQSIPLSITEWDALWDANEHVGNLEVMKIPSGSTG